MWSMGLHLGTNLLAVQREGRSGVLLTSNESHLIDGHQFGSKIRPSSCELPAM